MASPTASDECHVHQNGICQNHDQEANIQDEEAAIKVENQSNLRETSQIDKTLENSDVLCDLNITQQSVNEAHGRSLSAIDQVPVEIIGEIILHALGVYDSSFRGVTLCTTQGPWVYTRVCRSWRLAIFSHLTVWARVHADYRHTSEEEQGNNGSFLLDQIFAYAKSVPVNLTLVLDEELASESVLLTAVDHCEQWGTIYLKLPNSYLGHLKKIKGRIPHLESIQLKAYADENSAAVNSLENCLSIAPSLRRVMYSQDESSVDSIHIGIPWSQITEFISSSFYGHSATNFSTINFSCMVNLVRLLLRNMRMPSEFTSSCILLPNLESMVIHEEEYLPLFRVPALKEFHTCNTYPYEQLADLIYRSGCTITELIIRQPVGLLELSTLLRLCPSITTLGILRWDEESSMTIEALQDTGILPQLEHLIFPHGPLTYNKHTISHYLTLKLIQACCKTCSGQLTKVSLIYLTTSELEDDPELYQQFDQFCSSGVITELVDRDRPGLWWTPF